LKLLVKAHPSAARGDGILLAYRGHGASWSDERSRYAGQGTTLVLQEPVAQTKAPPPVQAP
jgi:hypothetical protein